MKAKVLTTFDYSDDGIRIRTLKVGEVVEIKNDLAPGLVAAQCIAPVAPTAPAPVVEPAAPAVVHQTYIGRGRNKRLAKDALSEPEAESALAELPNAPNSENAEG